MAKQPQAGAVKTRLCPPLTPAGALALYEAFLHDTIALVATACTLAGDVTPALAYAPAGAHDYFRACTPDRFVLLPQHGADLGERLSRLPAQAAARGYGPVAMIDSDSPTLPPAYAAQAFAALARADVDVVLGPCRDGGYYLIGMKAPQPALFRAIPWSTDQVTRATLAAAARAGLRVVCLPAWYDADTAADLETLRATLAADPARAPHTHEVLAGRGLPGGTVSSGQI
ncbi:MAG TPA: TIGR04282 family arsenosugar biosynthesis glycosyltransferase [Chloroflexia bacterium]|nr:TIGR04282 family arsenosugar biosynthesis glycosyltransferase [Chloroflexia bacterium]